MEYLYSTTSKLSTVKKFKTTIYDMHLKSLNVFLSLVSLASGTCVIPAQAAPKLLIVVAAALVRRVTCPNGKSVSNEKCCALFPVLEDIQANLFDHGECGEDAHSALRIAFHDAIGYSTTRKEA
jgi:hypothetical protein